MWPWVPSPPQRKKEDKTSILSHEQCHLPVSPQLSWTCLTWCSTLTTTSITGRGWMSWICGASGRLPSSTGPERAPAHLQAVTAHRASGTFCDHQQGLAQRLSREAPENGLPVNVGLQRGPVRSRQQISPLWWALKRLLAICRSLATFHSGTLLKGTSRFKLTANKIPRNFEVD
jgi:hypothetical protein